MCCLGSKLSTCGKRRLWSESSLGAHSLCWFCHEAAHLCLEWSLQNKIMHNVSQYYWHVIRRLTTKSAIYYSSKLVPQRRLSVLNCLSMAQSHWEFRNKKFGMEPRHATCIPLRAHNSWWRKRGEDSAFVFIASSLNLQVAHSISNYFKNWDRIQLLTLEYSPLSARKIVVDLIASLLWWYLRQTCRKWEVQA